MFSYQFYKVAHIVGLILVMSALGATALHAINGGTRQTNRARGLVAGLHGVGVLVILVAGFGMLARLGVMRGTQPGAGALSGWVVAKIVIWVLVAAALMIPYRRPALARPLYLLLPVLGGAAAYLAIYKPF
jgi:uncharacterized membrane protein